MIDREIEETTMTLRVTVEIVPHGDESRKYTIHTLNISNTGTKTNSGLHRYQAMFDGKDVGLRFLHRRDDGAIALIWKVISRLPERWRHLPEVA